MDSADVEYRNNYRLDPQDIALVCDASGIRRPMPFLLREESKKCAICVGPQQDEFRRLHY